MHYAEKVQNMQKYANKSPQFYKQIAKRKCFSCYSEHVESRKKICICIKILALFITLEKLDLHVLTETWLTPLNFDVLHSAVPENYETFSSIRSQKRGGGVSIIIKKSFSIYSAITESIFNCEIIILRFKNLKGFSIFGIYRPPTVSLSNTKKLFNYLDEKIKGPSLILGDFNLNSKSIKWNHGIPTPLNKIGQHFNAFFIKNKLSLHCKSPTRGTETLDLCLVNDNRLLINAETGDSLINSDHESIYINLSISLTKNPSTSISYRKFDSKNTNLINAFLSHNLDRAILTEPNIESKYNRFVKESLDGLNILAPKITFEKRTKSIDYPPILKASIKEKASLWKKLKKEPEKFLSTYKSISLHIKIQIKKFQEKQEKKFLDQNPRNIYKYIGKDFQRWDIPPITHDSQIITDDKTRTNIFAVYFSGTFQNSLKYPSPPPSNSTNKPSISDIMFNVLDVLEILTHLPLKNNTSPDNLGFNYLRKFHLILARPLTDLFKLSLNSGTLPKIWKTSIVLPLFKNGDKNLVSNYRPISITCSCCRVVERIIAKKLTDFLLENNLISKNQFGFLRKRSTTLQLISTLEDWYNAILHDKKIDCIYLDIIKAFDKVPHDLLIHKIEKIGIRGNLLRWLKDFLTDRTFKVRINQQYSQEFPIKSGVPQGSVLGPILFLIYINDLSQVIPEEISLKLFADDTKIYLSYSSESQRKKLEEALQQINQWAQNWGLEFSPEKSASLYLGKDNFKIPYQLNGKSIKETHVIRDLGILIDNKLKFNSHISAILQKAYLRSRTLFQKVKSKSSKTWITVYKSYIRPLLEFSSEIWNPHLKKQI